MASQIKSEPYVNPFQVHIPPKANDRQVGGGHYKVLDSRAQEHWDIVRFHKLDYFQGQITKYVMRHKNKNGIQDLKKAAHVLQKYIEVLEEDMSINKAEGGPTSGYVNQDR